MLLLMSDWRPFIIVFGDINASSLSTFFGHLRINYIYLREGVEKICIFVDLIFIILLLLYLFRFYYFIITMES